MDRNVLNLNIKLSKAASSSSITMLKETWNNEIQVLSTCFYDKGIIEGIFVQKYNPFVLYKNCQDLPLATKSHLLD